MADTLMLKEKYRRKYSVLNEKCREIEQDNRIMAYKLREIRRVVSRLRSEKRFLMKKLDQHGDEYRQKPGHSEHDVKPVVGHRGITHPVMKPMIRVIHPPEAFHPVASFIPIQTAVSETASKGKSPRRKGRGEVNKSEKRSADGGGKKLKADDDPNMPSLPRKPANAFLIFCQQNRESILEECGVQLQQQGPVHHELTRTLAKKWKEMASPEKKRFYELYEQEKLRYEREMEAFQAAGGVVPTKSSPGGRGSRKQGKEPKRKKGQGLVKGTPGIVVPGLEDTGSSAASGLFASPFGYDGIGLDDDDHSFGLRRDLDVKSALTVSPRGLTSFVNHQTPSRFSESPAVSSSNGEDEQDDMLF